MGIAGSTARRKKHAEKYTLKEGDGVTQKQTDEHHSHDLGGGEGGVPITQHLIVAPIVTPRQKPTDVPEAGPGQNEVAHIDSLPTLEGTQDQPGEFSSSKQPSELCNDISQSETGNISPNTVIPKDDLARMPTDEIEQRIEELKAQSLEYKAQMDADERNSTTLSSNGTELKKGAHSNHEETHTATATRAARSEIQSKGLAALTTAYPCTQSTGDLKRGVSEKQRLILRELKQTGILPAKPRDSQDRDNQQSKTSKPIPRLLDSLDHSKATKNRNLSDLACPDIPRSAGFLQRDFLSKIPRKVSINNTQINSGDKNSDTTQAKDSICTEKLPSGEPDKSKMADQSMDDLEGSGVSGMELAAKEHEDKLKVHNVVYDLELL